MESWNEVMASAKGRMSLCRACKNCNGIVCAGETPGCGGKGSGSSFMRNYNKLREICIRLDTIAGNDEISTASDFFGTPVALPVYAAPIGGIKVNYGADISEADYARELVEGCLSGGTLAFTGDGMNPSMFSDPVAFLKTKNGLGVPTVKPWDMQNMKWRIDEANDAGVLAICSDIDASGLTGLRNSTTPVEYKSVDDLKQISVACQSPFIVKGILSVDGAMKALEANASGIVVSNHGGRVLDECLSGIEVLESIVQAVNGKMKIFVDGGFRSGNDVFKALALGADGVLIGRPFSHAVIGDGREGVNLYIKKLQLELKEAMAMAGCKTIQEITRDCVTVNFK